MAAPDPIILHTIRDARTLACPLCDFTIDVPAAPISDQVGAALGMSGTTLAMVHAEQVARTAAVRMRNHLEAHPVEDWLPIVAGADR